MDKQQILEKAKQIVDPARQAQLLYECLDALGITYHKTACHKCRRDLYLILLEELDLIEDASDMSAWDTQDTEWIYTYPRTVKCEGKTISKKTPQHILSDFCEKHPTFCMKQHKINFSNK